jgi:hypothetical protein
MSMIPPIDDDRFSQGMSTERYHPWYGDGLEPQPVATENDGIPGMVAIVTLHSPEGGMTYEQTENVNGRHHRIKASPAIPDIVRHA